MYPKERRPDVRISSQVFPALGTISIVSGGITKLGVRSSAGTGDCRAATSVSKVAATHYHCAPAILGRNQRSVPKQYATAEDVLRLAGTSAYPETNHHTSSRVSPPIPASFWPCSEVLARQSND